MEGKAEARPDGLEVQKGRAPQKGAGSVRLGYQCPDPALCKKVFQSVCEELLAPAVCCCWVLNNHSKMLSSTRTEVITKIQENLHQGLFIRENAAAFEKHLCDTPDSPSVGNKGVELYFHQLDQLAKDRPDPSMSKLCALPAGGIEDAVLLYLPAAFNSFLASAACTDITRTGFAMLQTLCGFTRLTAENDMETAENVQEEDCMDVDADVDVDKKEVSVKAQEKRLVATRDLLQTALDRNIYRALDDAMSGGKQLAWLRKLLHTLLQTPTTTTAARLDCMRLTAARLDCMRLTAARLDCMRLLLDMNHQVVAPRLADVWTCSWLLLDIMVDTLLVAMLESVVKNQNQLSFSKTFSPLTLQRWSELVQGLPVGLAMEIWQGMLNKLQEQYQLDLPQLKCTSACLEQMTTLLCLFLLHLRLWDVNITSPTATRVDQLMASTCSSVISPLFKLCLATKQVDEYLHFSALHLCHTWCQLHMLSIHMKGSKHSNESVPNLGVHEEWWDFSLQYPHVSPGEWSTLCQKLLKANSKRIRYVLVTSVTSDSYSTARWYLLCSNIGLIVPLCTQRQLALWAHSLLQTVVTESCPNMSARLVTRAMISADLLQSATYLELLPMQEAMITAILRGLADSVDCSRNASVIRLCVKVLQELSEDFHPVSATTGPEEDTPQLSKAITSAAVALQSLQKAVQKKCTVYLSGKQLQMMCHYFKVLQRLPLQCLSGVSSVRCVLGCLAVNCLLGASHSVSDYAPAVLRTNLEVLRDVMTGQRKTSLWQTLDAAVTMKCLLLTCERTQDKSQSMSLDDTYQDLMYHLLWSVVMQNKVKVPTVQGDIIASCTRQLAMSVAAVVHVPSVGPPAVAVVKHVPSVDLPAVTTAMAAALRVQMGESQVGEDWTPCIERHVCSLKTMLTEIQANLQNIRACLGFLKTVAGGVPKWQAVLPEEFEPTVYNLAVQLLLSVHSTNKEEPSESASSPDMADVVAEAEALLLIVCRCSQPEQFCTYIEGLQQHLDGDASVCAALQLWQLVLREEWKDEKRDAVNSILPQLVLQLQVLLQKSCSKVTVDDVLKQTVVPSLQTTAAMLQVGQTAAFLVAEYVSELQHGTLHPDVKKSLVPSVYLLLDVCGMHGSKLLGTALDPGLREIYKALHTDYSRYHKYRGKV
uniref:Nucleolar 27S pre-rRNA processing Urb2/Npa2 C-terminal domain-containing protein n=1 Tax=Branchiostoma floridae TaxID=7739 RepID=C3XZE7_BRAFL|eukprot:XP_002610701.1 hypothetical protein BRAFLDRAFT_117943 [Branchiostoma floridae]